MILRKVEAVQYWILWRLIYDHVIEEYANDSGMFEYYDRELEHEDFRNDLD